MYLGTRRLQAVDRRFRETDVEEEARLEKNHLQAADRRARETQKEKGACLEKNRIRSANRRLDQSALKRSATNVPRDDPLPADTADHWRQLPFCWTDISNYKKWIEIIIVLMGNECTISYPVFIINKQVSFADIIYFLNLF